jgi:hypothetical protein
MKAYSSNPANIESINNLQIHTLNHYWQLLFCHNKSYRNNALIYLIRKLNDLSKSPQKIILSINPKCPLISPPLLDKIMLLNTLLKKQPHYNNAKFSTTINDLITTITTIFNSDSSQEAYDFPINNINFTIKKLYKISSAKIPTMKKPTKKEAPTKQNSKFINLIHYFQSKILFGLACLSGLTIICAFFNYFCNKSNMFNSVCRIFHFNEYFINNTHFSNSLIIHHNII